MAGKKSGSSSCQSNQRLPAGQFDSNGTSQGKAVGNVRPAADAYQGARTQQSDPTPAKPAN